MQTEKEKYEIIKFQEETLIFDHFDNEDAWNLGKQIIEDARKDGVSIVVEIWINGYMVFKYGLRGTNSYNDIWLKRKVNTVNMMGRSTLRVHYMPYVGEDDLREDAHLNLNEYSNMGGGFPICVKGAGIIGILAVSGLTHIHDHQRAVEGIAKYLGITSLQNVIDS